MQVQSVLGTGLGVIVAIAATSLNAPALGEAGSIADALDNIGLPQPGDTNVKGVDSLSHSATASPLFGANPVFGSRWRFTSQVVLPAVWSALGYEKVLGVVTTETLGLFPEEDTLGAIAHPEDFVISLDGATLWDLGTPLDNSEPQNTQSKNGSRFAHLDFDKSATDNWSDEYDTYWCGGAGLGKLRAKDLQDASCTPPRPPGS